MLETVDFSIEDLSKEEYKASHDEAVEKLVVLQQQARQQGIGLVVLFEGWNGAGKGSRISDLMYNLDARATTVHVTKNLDRQAAHVFAGADWGVMGDFPLLKEFWDALGQRGTMTFFDKGWYTTAMQHLLYDEFGTLSLPKGKKKRAQYMEAIGPELVEAVSRHAASVADFERQLVDDGYTVVKFFVHVSKEGQKKNLTKLYNDPATRWRVSEDKLARVGKYEEAYRVYDRLLENSDFEYAPWVLLNGENKRRANVTIVETLTRAIEAALAATPDAAAAAAAQKAQENSAGTLVEKDASSAEEGSVPVVGEQATAAEASGTSDAPAADVASEVATDGAAQAAVAAAAAVTLKAAEQSSHAPALSRFAIVSDYPQVDSVDHTLTLPEEEYRAQLKKLQKRLRALESEMYQKRVPLMVMYEGWDAAGKGGNIKRVAQALDARSYTIFPSPAPTRPELMHPHLWRYWTRLPRAGHVGIYDRSWYGRVLVERVEGFATPEQWSRAYDEINAFERDLVNWGAILLKFWVEVSPDEQLRRFQDRQNTPAKQWKITDEDWRNREKYPLYKAAVDDMFRLTSTTVAPWTVLESDDKRYARVKALEKIVAELEARLH